MKAKPVVATAGASAAAGGESDHTAPPAWAVDQVGGAAVRRVNGRAAGAVPVEVLDGGAFALTTARVSGAAALDADALERRVTEAYAAIFGELKELSAGVPVRLWNHIPSIHGRMDARRDRYMVFNAGRYRAFAELYGGPDAFAREVATASGVGHGGDDLVVHCLSARSGGLAVENPRQIAPHRYSEKYGPLPPCFARATVLAERGLILVGGTASIRGEDSLFPASLQLQLAETLTNLASVAEAAAAKAGGGEGGGGAVAPRLTREQWLRRYRDVRVYYPRPADREALESASREAFGARCRVEMCRADLCRAELLVEIEGVAGLGG